jgi:hypothetical protein
VFDDDNYDGPDQTYYFDEKDPEFPPGPDPEDHPDAEQPQASEKHAAGTVDNAARHVSLSSGKKLLNPRQMEHFFT